MGSYMWVVAFWSTLRGKCFPTLVPSWTYAPQGSLSRSRKKECQRHFAYVFLATCTCTPSSSKDCLRRKLCASVYSERLRLLFEGLTYRYLTAWRRVLALRKARMRTLQLGCGHGASSAAARSVLDRQMLLHYSNTWYPRLLQEG